MFNNISEFSMNDEIELDRRLKQMVLTAQQHPTQSDERRSALNILVKAILKSGKLMPTGNNSFERDIYDDALQDLFVYLCENIEKYDLTQGFFMSWLKALMIKKFYREVKHKALEKNLKKTSISSKLEEKMLIESAPALSEIILICIEADPENIFKTSYIENYPKANFQALVGLRIDNLSWQDISAIMEVKSSTLNTFYLRSFKKFNAKIKHYIQSYEEYL